MKTKILMIVIVFIQCSSLAQSLWDKVGVPLEYLQTMGSDTSLIDLKSIVLNKVDNLINLKYVFAVRELVDKYEIEEKEFLLENLLTIQDTVLLNSSDQPLNDLWYFAFENDMIARGYLGDQLAVDGMRYLSDHPNSTDTINLTAIYYLSEAGIYEDYQMVLDLVNNQNPEQRLSPCYLRYFIRNSTVVDEIKNVLIPFIKNNQEIEYNELVSCCIDVIGDIDSAALVEALKWGFYNNVGELRLWFFNQIGKFDKDSQPNLSKFALINENSENLFSSYLPSVHQIGSKYVSKKYGYADWINFLRDFYNTTQNNSIKKRVQYFNNNFVPLKDETIITCLDYINHTNMLIDTTLAYSWLGDLTLSNDLKNILTTAKTNLQNGDSLACRVQVKAFQDLVDNVYKDSLNTDPRFVTIEGWKFLYWNAQYILDRLPEPQANPNLVVNLKNSLGNQIPASNVMYYESSWKDAVNNGDGTFTVITTRATVSIRVFYEYASQQVDNVPAQNNTYTFTTVNAAVQLKNSLGSFIDIGTVQYYAGAWRTFGTTSNGVAYKELLPINYSFRMTYEYGSIDKQQNLSTDPTVVFQTVNAAVQLKNSIGSLIDAGIVQYYAGAWRTFGTTLNGVAYRELLPVNYSFRMTHEYVSNDKQQNLSTNPIVDFSTVLCSVKVSKTSNNQPINNAAVKYYSGSWRNLGTTNSSGIATKELLPANISFRATLGSVSLDKQQDISVNNLVEILLNVP